MYSLLEESGCLNIRKGYTREELWKMLKGKGQMDIGHIFHPHDYNYRVSSIKDGTLLFIMLICLQVDTLMVISHRSV